MSARLSGPSLFLSALLCLLLVAPAALIAFRARSILWRLVSCLGLATGEPTAASSLDPQFATGSHSPAFILLSAGIVAPFYLANARAWFAYAPEASVTTDGPVTWTAFALLLVRSSF